MTLSVLSRCMSTRKLIHQASPQLKCFSLPRRRECASYPVDSHTVANNVEFTTSAKSLLPRDPEFMRLAVANRGLFVAQ
jgi:hypothetical protein